MPIIFQLSQDKPTKTQITKKADRYDHCFQNVCTGAKLGSQVLSEMDRIFEFMEQTETQGQEGEEGTKLEKHVDNYKRKMFA